MSLGNKQVMAENIKRLLDKKGLNPRQMALELGFKYTTVNDWVNAKSYPRIDKIELMARFFNVSKSELVEEFNPNKVVKKEKNIDQILNDYYINIKSDRESNGHAFRDEAFKNASLAYKSVPYLDIDQYTFELIFNSNMNNMNQIYDKSTLIEHFESVVKNLKIGQNDERVPREAREYLGVLCKQYESYLSILKNKE